MLQNRVSRFSRRESSLITSQNKTDVGMFSAGILGTLSSIKFLNGSFIFAAFTMFLVRLRYSRRTSTLAEEAPSAIRDSDASVPSAISIKSVSASGSLLRIESAPRIEVTAFSAALTVVFLSAFDGFRSRIIRNRAFKFSLSISVNCAVRTL